MKIDFLGENHIELTAENTLERDYLGKIDLDKPKLFSRSIIDGVVTDFTLSFPLRRQRQIEEWESGKESTGKGDGG